MHMFVCELIIIQNLGKTHLQFSKIERTKIYHYSKQEYRQIARELKIILTIRSFNIICNSVGLESPD